ncbi:MAG: hypothetical protein HQK78_10085 [Desulfobacterales bacterium]|nr:hypothetical protein [Desulfobacterales bacterium]
MTTVNDIVLIYFEDIPLTFAKIEDINPDIKKGWHHVKLLLLNIPLQVVTWILRDAYIDGDEFTMGGKKMRLEKVVCPEDNSLEEDDEEKDDAPPAKIEQKINENSQNNKVISLLDRRKR